VLENVRAGDYVVRVTHPDRHMPAEFPTTVGEESQFLDLNLSVCTLEGKVTDEEGQPIEGVRVWPELVTEGGDRPRAMMVSVMVMDDGDGGGNEVVSMQDSSSSSKQVTTDANGNYLLRGVRDGVDLVVKAEGAAVKPGQSETVHLAPDEHQQNVDLVLGAAGKIEVTATRADGTPAKNLIVLAVWAGPEEGQVDRKSGFIREESTVLDGLTPGPWTIEVRVVGGLGDGDEAEAIPKQNVTVVAGETAQLEFRVP
jgi:hypothetical protein